MTFKRRIEGTYIPTIYSVLDACLYNWRFDQSLESNRDQVLYASLQAPIVSNLYVCTSLCEIHRMGTQDRAQD